MSDTAAELVNLCSDEMPRRPTKRIRPERAEPRVLSLVDSEDETPASSTGPREQVGQAAERQPRLVAHWGAMAESQVSPRAVPERPPLYRPPSARFRRLAGTPYARRTNPSPIVIDDDDDDEDDGDEDGTARASSIMFQRLPGPARHNSANVDPAAGGVAPMLPPSATTTASAYGGAARLALGGPSQQAQPYQTVLQPPQQRQGDDEAPLVRQHTHANHHQLRAPLPDQPPPPPSPPRLSRRLPLTRPPAPAEPRQTLLFQQHQQQRQLRQPQRQQRQPEPVREGSAGGPLPGRAGDQDQEDEDMRLAARLQAEEDERLARETAQRLDQAEHRRVMSRLDMLETLESASRAREEVMNARRAAAMAAAERERASRRNERLERGAGGGGGSNLDGGDRSGDELPSWRMMALPRSARGPPGAGGSMALLGGRAGGGRRLDAAEAAVAAMAAAAAAAADEAESSRLAAVAAAAEAAAGRGRPRWSSQALNEMLPAMMALPFGLHRVLGGRGDPDDYAGSFRRARSGAAAAYREQAMAMREQLLAAQRAGIPAHLLLSDRDFTPEDYELLCRLDEQVENRKGAKEEQLAALPTEVVGGEGRRRSDGCAATCAICMEELAPGDVLKRLPCLHDFHGGCVDTWLKTKACCPICQRGLEA